MYRHAFCTLIAGLLAAVWTLPAPAQDDATDSQAAGAEQTATAAAAETADGNAAATADAEKRQQPVDPSGTWKWVRDFNGEDMEFVLKLNWDGKKLTGKYTAFDQTSEIQDAKLERDALSFFVEREFNGNEFDVDFDGKVADEKITGVIALDFGGGEQEIDWDAKRHVDVEGILGTWQLVLKRPDGGEAETKITFTKDGDKLAGDYENVFGRREAKNIAIKGTELTWEISGESDRGSFKSVYKGKVRGNKIAGTNNFNFGDRSGTMEFTGQRVPQKPERQAE